MVGNTGRTTDTRRIRRLKPPQALEVESGEAGTPLRIRAGGLWQEVTAVRRRWHVDQHWWRGEPISRVYYRVAMADGPPFSLYHDLISGTWARQEY